MFCRALSLAGVLSILLGLTIPSVYGQTAGTSRVTGVVLDQSGAVIPDAAVTLTNEGTNLSFKTTTTSAGVYVFDSMQLGAYTVTVEKQGFKKYVSKNNVLSLGQPLTINVGLTVGGAQEVVEVVASYER